MWRGIIMKCLLISFFNSHNIGDCMIAEILFEKVSKFYDTEKCGYAGYLQKITDPNNIKKTNAVKKRSNLRNLVYQLLHKFKLESVISTYRLLRYESCHYLKKKLQGVDLVVIGGGNMIFDEFEYSDSAFRFNKIVSMAKARHIKVFAISLGIGPFQTIIQEQNACKALNKCDYITFRDNKSYNIYAKHIEDLGNVCISIDPVFMIENYSSSLNKSKQIIGLNIMNSKLIDDSEDKYRFLIGKYTDLIDQLIENLDLDIVLFSTDSMDYVMLQDVYLQATKKKNIKIEEINGFDDLINLYNKIPLLIGMRMHAMIIAFTQGIPVIGLSWQPKVDAFFDIIDSKDSVFNYNDIENSVNDIVILCKEKLLGLDKEMKKNGEILRNIQNRRDIDSDILSAIMINNQKARR